MIIRKFGIILLVLTGLVTVAIPMGVYIWNDEQNEILPAYAPFIDERMTTGYGIVSGLHNILVAWSCCGMIVNDFEFI